MDELIKKLSEADNSGWTVIQKNAQDATPGDKRMTLEGGALIDARAETMNTIAAVGQLPDCAVLIITKEGNIAALSAATELYGAVKHFGHDASFLILKDQEASPEVLGEKWKTPLKKKKEAEKNA